MRSVSQSRRNPFSRFRRKLFPYDPDLPTSRSRKVRTLPCEQHGPWRSAGTVRSRECATSPTSGKLRASAPSRGVGLVPPLLSGASSGILARSFVSCGSVDVVRLCVADIVQGHISSRASSVLLFGPLVGLDPNTPFSLILSSSGSFTLSIFRSSS